MSEQIQTRMPETEQLDKAAQLAALNEQLQVTVPDSLAEAEATIGLASQVAEFVTKTGTKKNQRYAFEGEEVPAELGEEMHTFVNRGVENWRLTKNQRSSWQTAASAEHPSELGLEQFARLKELKNDPMEPNGMALERLKAEAAKRLKLDEEIAASQGKKVVSTSYEAKQARTERVDAKQAEKTAAKLAADREKAFERIVSFSEQPDSEFASGADIKKAIGLSREDMLQLGYNSYADMKAAATTWKAEKDEAARVAKYHADNKAHADAWKADADAYRSNRDAANARVQAISYKEKLARGGEIGLRRNPSLTEDIRQIAIDRAEAEGLNVNHLKPRHIEVVRDEAGEARTSELGALLKQHDREMLLAQSKKTSAEADSSAEGDQTFTPEVLEALAAARAGEPAGAPVTATAQQGRMRRLFGKLSDATLRPVTALQNRLLQKLSSRELTEKDLKQRRVIMNVAIGVVAVGGIAKAYLGIASGHSALQEAVMNRGGGGTSPDLLDALGGGTGTGKSSNGEGVVSKDLLDSLGTGGSAKGSGEKNTQALVEQLPQYNSKTGDGTVEGLVHNRLDELGYKATKPQLHELTDATLHKNGQTWESARSLPVGARITQLSPEQIEEILAKSK